jgi:hypothetical protein
LVGDIETLLQYYCNKSAHNSIAIYFFLALVLA